MDEEIFLNNKKMPTKQGYVLIDVGKEHNLADCRGYALLHRLVAQIKLGRPLKKGEIVHHIDHDKSNNNPDNLKVFESQSHHLVEHRVKMPYLKHPDQENYYVECKCGCGEKLLKYSPNNIPREYVRGHNTPLSKVKESIIEFINGSEIVNIKEIYSLMNKSSKSYIRCLLLILINEGKIKRVSKGFYCKAI